MILDAVTSETYPVTKQEVMIDLNFGLNEAEQMMRDIHNNHIRKSSAPSPKNRKSGLKISEKRCDSALPRPLPLLP